jgi:hypothetical protein
VPPYHTAGGKLDPADVVQQTFVRAYAAKPRYEVFAPGVFAQADL